MTAQSVVFGIIGLAGYEGLRLYKSYLAGDAPIPARRRDIYLCILVVLAVFAGACAYAMANGNLTNSLFVGFSVPTGIRALLAPGSLGSQGIRRANSGREGRESGDVNEVDDLEVEGPIEPNRGTARMALFDYFA